MSTSARVGRSLIENGFEAGRSAAEQALDGLPGHRADVAIVFATTGYDQEDLLRGVRGVVGGVKLVGCSAEGVIFQGDSVECDHAVAIMAVQSDALSFETFLEPYLQKPFMPFVLVERVRQLLRRRGLRVVRLPEVH